MTKYSDMPARVSDAKDDLDGINEPGNGYNPYRGAYAGVTVRATVEVPMCYAHLYEVDKTLTVEAAWWAGLDPTAYWTVVEIEHASSVARLSLMSCTKIPEAMAAADGAEVTYAE